MRKGITTGTNAEDVAKAEAEGAGPEIEQDFVEVFYDVLELIALDVALQELRIVMQVVSTGHPCDEGLAFYLGSARKEIPWGRMMYLCFVLLGIWRLKRQSIFQIIKIKSTQSAFASI